MYPCYSLLQGEDWSEGCPDPHRTTRPARASFGRLDITVAVRSVRLALTVTPRIQHEITDHSIRGRME